MGNACTLNAPHVVQQRDTTTAGTFIRYECDALPSDRPSGMDPRSAVSPTPSCLSDFCSSGGVGLLLCPAKEPTISSGRTSAPRPCDEPIVNFIAITSQSGDFGSASSLSRVSTGPRRPVVMMPLHISQKSLASDDNTTGRLPEERDSEAHTQLSKHVGSLSASTDPLGIGIALKSRRTWSPHADSAGGQRRHARNDTVSQQRVASPRAFHPVTPSLRSSQSMAPDCDSHTDSK